MEGTAKGNEELKAQGVVEAAQDPNSSVNAADAEEALKDHARAGGAAAFEFNPDASPEEKAAQAKERAGPRLHRKHQTAALVTDADDGYENPDLPPPSKEGAISTIQDPAVDAPDGVAPHEDDEYGKVGWAPRFGNPGDADDEDDGRDHQTFLEGKIDDKFFGDWYHNAGLIIFACLSSWTIAVLGGGLGWIFILMTVCGTYYRTSLRRVRRNFRDDIIRQLTKNKLETDVESLEWINNFMSKFWPIYAPILCSGIIASVDQVLSTSTPAFLDSMRMKFFTLGTKPPRLEHVKTYPREEDDVIIMDWKFSFTPNDVSDLTTKQVKLKVNPKIVLEVRVGKAMISKGLDVIVEDMACAGIMRVKMKLMLSYPFVEKVEICFLERPMIDYVCKPLGGDTLGFDINFVPGLESFIQEQIHANLGPMMYSPNVFPIELAKMLAGTPVDQAIGVLQITFHGAHGLKNPDKFSGTPDPYATVSIDNRDVLSKTRTIEGNANPRWNETVSIILTSLREPLTLGIFDYNEFRKDKELGIATFDLEQLSNDHEFINQNLEVIANGRPRGAVQVDIRFFPVIESQKLDDGTEIPPPESLTGIAKFTVEQAKDLDGSKSLIGQLNPYAVLLLNGKEVQISQKLKRTNNPIWTNATKEMLITDRKKAKLGLIIKDDRDLASDPIIASYQIKLDDMLNLTTKGQEWYNLAGAKTGRAKMKLQWKPVALKGGASGGNGYIDPIGVMRFHFQNAKGLKNLDTVGKSDPYARVLLSGIQKGRTVTFKNNLNPEWDEVFYVPVHSTREKLVVEVMDEENVGKDQTMGQIEIDAAEYIRQTETGEYAVQDSKHDVISAQLRIGRSQPKGELNFTVAFYPTLNVAEPEEEEEEGTGEEGENGTRTSTEVPNGGSVSGSRHSRSGTVSSLKAGSVNSKTEEMRKALAENEKEQTEAEEVKQQEVPKIKIGVDDLVNYESGLIVFTIHEGELAHSNSYLQVLMDDMKYPAWQSAKMKTRNHTFNETGDAMVRELDLSRITLRLVTDTDIEHDKDDDIKARVAAPTIETLKRSLYTPQLIVMKDEHGHESKIKVSMRYLPVKMQLDPSESFNNQGNLRVEVLDAADLPAADRNGFSDPFCKFVLNGKEVYKTAKQKKTLHPAWNEYFEVPVISRTAAKFQVDVYDWDFGDKNDFLGAAAINLDVLEPFQAQEVLLNLDGKSGVVRLKVLFKPDYITRSRQGSSTFSGTFAAPGKIIGAPVKGVGKVASGVGGGIFRGATFVGRGFKRRTVSGAQEVPDDAAAELRPTSMESQEGASRPSTAANGGYVNGSSIDGVAGKDSLQAPRTPGGHQRESSFGQHSLSPASGEIGTATISVLSATGFPEDVKLEVHVHQGSKEVIKTKAIKAKTGEASWEDEEKKIECNAAAPFRLEVKNDKVFKDEKLGESTFYINDSAGGGEREVRCGAGHVVIRTSFRPTEAGSIAPSTQSPASKKGFGKLLGRSSGRDRERSVTPSG
ncbi:Putative C2 domain, synaptotagmin-like mitochondrial-lipid-binding domain, C2 domain superfamily [Septoria linicola]|uniref:C2 domain, synaptotagmin-like mitochondrial-lipid-binding domain, C2 domain superfamily n=1 Tax=Septoria linicola TaxID=215465 RepID=A0A9Q9AS61_9PEZI|nr:putative C2 domain, synaptotagmin-like mitochondrial-lipid-binding domain, C2 domain superfamily [Septoria linicola]USW53634.1 Putative C2 domain, synaptotagmin-like mitochondrial-lipid-binding domain, C2 domain superfamily [Septoria linicola]